MRRAGPGVKASEPASWRAPDLDVKIGVSACLLGEHVRYDGGHKRDAFVVDTLGRYVTWVSVCPEMEIGLGAPREPIRLQGDPAAPRLVGTTTGIDLTRRMTDYARSCVRALAGLGLSGYILKRASPSCGMERVKVYSENGMPGRAGRGLFASALMDGLPLLPVEEEGRLSDPRLRENFITRVFAHRRLRALREAGGRPRDVVAFHTDHKLLLLAHSPRHYAALGRLVARTPTGARASWLDAYAEQFIAALGVMATTKKHVNVLQHILGFFKDRLAATEKRELLGLIDDYAQGLVPLVVPITLVNHYVTRFDIAYVRDQVYLRPHPKELMLRNHV
jgi:uncharacterized protein YbgA (DUF1722 family)/uncharacterized protein YbbK (DUF523 family)